MERVLGACLRRNTTSKKLCHLLNNNLATTLHFLRMRTWIKGRSLNVCFEHFRSRRITESISLKSDLRGLYYCQCSLDLLLQTLTVLKNNGRANQQTQLNSYDIRDCSTYFPYLLFRGILIPLLCFRALKPHWLFYDIYFDLDRRPSAWKQSIHQLRRDCTSFLSLHW